MGKCKHYEICGIEDPCEIDDYLCILHCPDPNKSQASLSRCQVGSRYCVYDEIIPLNEGERQDWEQLEELYRHLKQNYEERRDYERAGHFHIGEKEMRLRNPDTRLHLRLLLAFYKVISGYGENYFRPLMWLFLVVLITSATGLARIIHRF